MIIFALLVSSPHVYIQDLAGMAHDDIDPSVFSDEQMVSSKILRVQIIL